MAKSKVLKVDKFLTAEKPVEAEILDDGSSASAISPSGASTGHLKLTN